MYVQSYEHAMGEHYKKSVLSPAMFTFVQILSLICSSRKEFYWDSKLTFSFCLLYYEFHVMSSPQAQKMLMFQLKCLQFLNPIRKEGIWAQNKHRFLTLPFSNLTLYFTNYHVNFKSSLCKLLSFLISNSSFKDFFIRFMTYFQFQNKLYQIFD